VSRNTTSYAMLIIEGHIINDMDNKLLNINEISKLASKYFTKPKGVNQKDFEKQIKKEFQDGYIDIVIRETTFRRKLVENIS